jgi:hypothetical protein
MASGGRLKDSGCIVGAGNPYSVRLRLPFFLIGSLALTVPYYRFVGTYLFVHWFALTHRYR